jgi:hypothetical protein
MASSKLETPGMMILAPPPKPFIAWGTDELFIITLTGITFEVFDIEKL